MLDDKKIDIKLVEYVRGKYYIDIDTEVYVYPMIGRLIGLVVKSKPGELPDPREVIKNTMQQAFDVLKKDFPRLAPQINGIIYFGSRSEAKKEIAPHRQDTITTEERGVVTILPCHYIIASGQSRKTLEDIFGNIF